MYANSRELLEKFLIEITGSVTGMLSTPNKPSVTTTTSVPVPQTDRDYAMRKRLEVATLRW